MSFGSTSNSLNKYDSFAAIRTGLIALGGTISASFFTELGPVLDAMQAALVNVITSSAGAISTLAIALVVSGADLLRRYQKDYSGNKYA